MKRVDSLYCLSKGGDPEKIDPQWILTQYVPICTENITNLWLCCLMNNSWNWWQLRISRSCVSIYFSPASNINFLLIYKKPTRTYANLHQPTLLYASFVHDPQISSLAPKKQPNSRENRNWLNQYCADSGVMFSYSRTLGVAQGWWLICVLAF